MYVDSDVRNVNGGFPPSAAECQRLCAAEPFACDTFTFYADSRACWLLKGQGLKAEHKIGAISGPKDCASQLQVVADTGMASSSPGAADNTLTDAETNATVTAAAAATAPGGRVRAQSLPAVESPADQSFASRLQQVPWWGWTLAALGVAAIGMVICIPAFCCVKQGSGKRRTRNAKLVPDDSRTPVVLPAESHDEAAQPLIPQLLPQPILPVPTLASPIPTFTAVTAPQAAVPLPQRLVEVRAVMPFSVMQAPAMYPLDAHVYYPTA